MIEEVFADGDSVIHQVDPRFKLVAAIGFSLVVAVSHRFPTLLGALIVAAALVFAARLNLLMVLRRLLVVVGFLILLWVILPFSVAGPNLYRIGSLVITRPGSILAAQISLKSLAILAAFIALVATMNFSILGHALDGLHLPTKLVCLLLFTYRYIFVIEQEYQRLVRACRVRGFRPRTDMHTYKTIAYLIAMLFVRAAVRAERVEQAMRCRGFNGRFYCLADFPSDLRHWLFAVIMVCLVSGLVLLEMWESSLI
ncbi:MAG: cobalt ECF transporter T component CbiQ [Deltaproteobacteria bacterium]|nr:cobalt ECF transporter T component CbiQ [Deltaproteobacteria bacterium]